jgi:hypothetical protein
MEDVLFCAVLFLFGPFSALFEHHRLWYNPPVILLFVVAFISPSFLTPFSKSPRLRLIIRVLLLVLWSLYGLFVASHYAWYL